MSGSFLYCIEMEQGALAKVGIAYKPKQRLSAFRASSPFAMRFRHVLEVERDLAAAYERHILASARRYRNRGEWVYADKKLDRLFAEVSPAINRTEEFQIDGTDYAGRPIVDDTTRSMEHIHQARLRAQVGRIAAARIAYDGTSNGYARAVIHARLADGYGVEDIAAMDGIDIEEARAEVRHLRDAGCLSAVLRGQAPVSKRRASA